MALLAPQTPVITGLTPTYAAATAGGDTVNGDDNGFLIVKNASASPVTVTIIDPRSSDVGQANPDPPVSVPATTGERWIGPMRAELANFTTGLVDITYSAVTSVTVVYVTT